MRVFAVIGLLVMGTLVLGLSRAFAQGPAPRPERPSRSLFGGTHADMEPVLTLTASMGGGYDTNIMTAQNSASLVNPGFVKQSASFEDVQLGLSFGSSWGKLGVGASANSSASYYQINDDPLLVSHGAGLGVSYQLGRRTEVTASESVSFEPYFSMGLFPGLYDLPLGQTQATASSRATSAQNRMSLRSGVGLTHTLTRKISLALAYDNWKTTSPYDAWDFSNKAASGHVLFGMGKGLALRLGYSYTDSRYGASGTQGPTNYTGQSFDGGLDFNRALSLSRRVTLTFSTGTTFVGYQDQTHFEVVGNARINREIGRTWNLAFAYARTVSALDSLRDPVVADSFTLGTGGLINRRLEFHSSLGASLGAVGFDKTASGYRSLYGNAGLSIGLTRRLAVGVGYDYYRYFFGQGVALPVGFSSDEDRHSIRAHLSVSLPLSERQRRADASR